VVVEAVEPNIGGRFIAQRTGLLKRWRKFPDRLWASLVLSGVRAKGLSIPGIKASYTAICGYDRIW